MLDKKTIYNQVITRRAFILATGKCSLLSLLTGRLFYLQTFESNEYDKLAKINSIHIIRINPTRGQIYDVNGKIVAENKKNTSIILDSHLTIDYKNSLNQLQKVLNLSKNQLQNINRKIKKEGTIYPVTIMENLTWPEIVAIEENITKLPGLYLENIQTRFYPHQEAMSNVSGYYASPNKEEKNSLNIPYIHNFNVGKSGLEKFYENKLRGKFGSKKIEINARGNYIKEIDLKKSTKGQNLTLNIDADLQKYIYNMLPKSGASVIVQRIKDGTVMAAVSAKSYNANDFISGISQNNWQKINNDNFSPLLNRNIQATYPPGSIFKIVTIMAALENGFDPKTRINCTGGPVFSKTNYLKCWNRLGHGEIDMHHACIHSCNTYMYNIAKKIGANAILDTARKLGLGNLTGIDLPSELSGNIPQNSWKYDKYSSLINLAEQMNISIGQGPLLTTPIQMVNLITTIANNGIMQTPRIHDIGPTNELSLNKDYFSFIQRTMHDAVNAPGGTSYHMRIHDPNWQMAGKTGTIQVRAKKGLDLNSKKVDFLHRNHASFGGYAPYNNPLYSIYVIVEHGGGASTTAAPIARATLSEIKRRYHSSI